MRPGTRAAQRVLADVLRDFDIILVDLQGLSRFENAARAKQAFIMRCGELKIPVIVMAETIRASRFTVAYHLHPETRERRKRKQRYRKAKARIASKIAFDVHHFPIGPIFPRGVYTSWEGSHLGGHI
jgi:hypothetical protein